MKLLEIKNITQKEIEYINKFMADGLTLRSIVKLELGKDATEVEIEGNFQKLNTSIKKSNYSLNRQKNIYELKNKTQKKKKTDDSSSKNQDINKKNSCSAQEEPNQNTELNNNKRKKVRKKSTKTNPLAISSSIDIVKIICEHAGKKENRTPTGVYIMKSIEKEFSILEHELYYLPGYTLIDAALILSSCYVDTLEKSNVFKSFTQIVRNQKNSSSAQKKQINVKLSKQSIEAIDKLSHKFPFLNKSEIVNLSMYALSQSSKVSFLKEKENEKQHNECIN